MTEKLSDEWQTPQWLFDELNKEFNFDIDLCATNENSKCDDYYDDYLREEVREHIKVWTCAFMNPPYSNPKSFIETAWEDSKHCKIVCLVKCDPSTKWWSTFWDYDIKLTKKDYEEVPRYVGGFRYIPPHDGTYAHSGPKPGCEVRFFPKRIKFDPPQGFEGKVSSPSFPSALVIMDRRGI